MQLRLKTDFALRVLLYLAHRERTTGERLPVRVEAVANAYDISKEHLVKVVQQLATHGWVVTKAGRGGGLQLAVEPGTIEVVDVIEAFEERRGVLECVETPRACILEPGCGLRRLLMRAEDAFYDSLAGVTVADLVGGRRGGVHNLPLSA